MEVYMLEALEEAKKALSEFNEVPVGCVFVYKDNIIARGHNLVNLTKNPTRHAECKLIIDFICFIFINYFYILNSCVYRRSIKLLQD